MEAGMAQATNDRTTGSSAEDFEALREDLRRLRADMDKLVGSLTKEQKGRAEQLRQAAEEKLGQARDRAKDSLDSAAALGRESMATLERSVAERPLTTLLAAFGAGIAIGHLLRRR
jgi:ElaB/YqjD/DUF883 family membrane-anchored ribosome-binding protein